MSVIERFNLKVGDFQLFELPVEKHGTHDQKTHGSWANGSSESDYEMSHRPSLGSGTEGDMDGASLDNVSNGIYPDDVYSPRGVQIYGTGYKELDKQAHALIMEYRGKPEKSITIYRAIPKDASTSKIGGGEWVTPIKQYAVQHGQSNLNDDYQILTREVKAKEIFTSGDSWLEWGYAPTPVQKHATHDQSSHGNWARDNFNEETQGEDAQNLYFDKYGMKFLGDGKKEPVGISKEEIYAIDFYTGDGFSDINTFWRDGKNETTPNNTSQEVEWNSIEELSSNLDKAIEESPELFGDKNLYRVVGKSLTDELEEGDILTDKGFTSTTRVDITSTEGLEVLQNLQLLTVGDVTPSIILPSESKRGKGLAVDYLKNAVADFATNVANSNNEKEVLLPRGTSLKFKGYKRVNEGTDNVMRVAIFERMDK